MGDRLIPVYLKPGEMYFSEEPAEVVTVLGSCLSITMFHRKRAMGGICHGLLPTCSKENPCGGSCLEGFKYVDCSIRRMISIFDQHKVRRSEIEVKYFGGADMFSREPSRPNIVSVGRQNINSAEDILRHEGLVPHAMDVGGAQGRKIYFYTHTGEVLLKRLKRNNTVSAIPGGRP